MRKRQLKKFYRKAKAAGEVDRPNNYYWERFTVGTGARKRRVIVPYEEVISKGWRR